MERAQSIPPKNPLNFLAGRTSARKSPSLAKGDQPLREKINANKIYHVRPDGLDTNNGLTNRPDGAFLTIQAAVDAAYRLDLNGYRIVIRVAAGVYTDPVVVSGPLVGSRRPEQRPLKIIGDGKVTLSTTNSNALCVGNGAYLLLDRIKTETRDSGHGWVVENHGTLEYRDCEIGDVALDMLAVKYHSSVKARGKLSISGSARSFVHVTAHGRLSFNGQVIAFNPTTPCVFSRYFWGLNDATIALDGATITGLRPTGDTTIHNHSLLNAYSVRNDGGWGYLGVGTLRIEDGSTITADGYRHRTFYVRADADGDTNDGLESTPGRAFKSIQRCIDFIAGLPFNAAAFSTTEPLRIRIADGTYPEFVKLRDMKCCRATLSGNKQSPANVLIGSAHGIATDGSIPTSWAVDGVKLTASNGYCLRVDNRSVVTYRRVEFGSASAGHVKASHGGVAIAEGDYVISGDAPTHLEAVHGGIIDVSSRTVAIKGTPSFSAAFLRARNNSAISANATKWVGRARGARYHVGTCSSIEAKNGAGLSDLPGHLPGSATSGGHADQRHSPEWTERRASIWVSRMSSAIRRYSRLGGVLTTRNQAQAKNL